MSDYPKFYRNGGRCIRVDSDTRTWTIILPPEIKVASRYPTTYPSAERLQEDLRDMEEVGEDIFKSFLFTFYQTVASERETMNQQRQQLFNLKQ